MKGGSGTEPVIFTIGHSTRSLEELLSMLQEHGVERLVDVRTIPRSRRNPQFERENLARFLRGHGIGYRHMKSLGGLRRARPDSPNRGWRNDSFRGYADHMLTAEFETALEGLVELAREKPLAILCAESLPWRCHRSLIADALTVRGVPVRHIMSRTAAREHELNPIVAVEGVRITYPG